MKTGQHTGEQTWAEGENTAQSKFPHCQTMRSLCFLFDCLCLCQERTNVWDDLLSNVGECTNPFAVALAQYRLAFSSHLLA